MQRLWIAAVFLLSVPAAEAGTLGVYTFTTQPGDEASVPVDTQPPSATFSDLVRGSGLTPNAGAMSINSRDWTNGSVDYYQFGVTPASGQVLNLESLVFTDRRSATGPTNIQVRFSLDNFATSQSLASNSYTPDDTANRRELIPLAVSSLQSLSSEAIFRIYGFGATNTQGTGTYRLGVDTNSANSFLPANLIVNTVTAAVPEPSSLVMIGIGLLGAACYGRLRRSRIAA